MNRHLTSPLNHAPSPLLSVSYKSPELLDELLNNLPDPVVITDENFIITGINHTAEAIFGFRSDETIGKVMFSLFEFEVINGSWGEVIKELYNSGAWNGELTYYHNEVKKLYFNTTCTLIKSDKNEKSAVVFVCHNITETVLQNNQFNSFQNKYQTVVESLSDGVVMINSKGLIETANKRAVEILGFSKDELEGKVVACPSWKATKEDGTIFPLDEFPALITLTTGEPTNNVVMGIEHLDGKKVWIKINSRAIFIPGKIEPEAVVTSFEEITEQKKAKEKLIQSELIFSTFIHNSLNANWIYDEDGYIVLANNIYNTITNAPVDANGKHLTDIFPEDFAIKLLERNKKILNDGLPIVSENDLLQADGNYKTFISYLFSIPNVGGKKLIGGQSIDVTEIKKAHEKVEESNMLFGAFMSNSPNLGWVYDEDGTFIYGNPYFLERIGLTEHSIGKNIRDLSGPVLAETILEKNRQVLEKGETLITEDQFPEEDGSISSFLAYWFELPLKNGKRMIGGHAIDITERKKMKDELTKAQILKQKQINIAALSAQEEERNRLSEELHDNVNQLLFSSKLHIGAAKNAGDKQGELLDKASDYILMAVEEIRKLSKSLNSKIISSVGIQKSISDIVLNLKQLTNIDVETDIDSRVIDKLNHEQQLMVFRVVQEQTNNIVKYADAKKVHIALNEEADMFKLIIADNGKGFDVSSIKEKKSSGIGFTNMHSRVNACNGNLQIISAPGNGCCLQILFPSEKNQVAQ